jgi:hypothetical protein
MLARHEPDPSGEVSPRFKGVRIGDGCCNRGCTYHANARHTFEPLALVAGAVLGMNASFEPTYLLAESYELHDERLQGQPHRLW